MITSITSSNLNNVIPQPSPKRKPSQTSFGMSESSADRFESPQNESFLHRYRGLIGFFAGTFAGGIINSKYILPKVKNLTSTKAFLISFPVDIGLGLLCQVLAMKMGNNKD